MVIGMNSPLDSYMKIIASFFVAIALLASSPGHVLAQDEVKGDPFALFEAYQVGYLQVVAISCFQLYSSAGIIATDLSDGHIDGVTALYALEQNRLLLSACMTTLDSIASLTPVTDEAATAELLRLSGLLSAIGELYSALDDVCLEPTETNAANVEAERVEVEALFDEYVGNSI